MTKKYLLFSLEDEKTKGLAEAISNPTCKRILDILSEKELTEREIANELKMPQNTIEYNIKKLVNTGLIEQKSHFWSVKNSGLKPQSVFRVFEHLENAFAFFGLKPRSVRKEHFLSVKGKKMPVYTVSNKHIIISPKRNKLKSFIPVLFISILGAFVIKFFQLITSSVSYASKNIQIATNTATDSMLRATESIPAGQVTSMQPELIREILIGSAWLWFLAGSLFALLIFFIFNYKMKGGENG